MCAIDRAALAAAAMMLIAAQSPADAQPDTRVAIDRLLDAVRANDEALFATLVGGMDSDQPADAANGPQLGDYGARPTYYGALTLAALRRFAGACRYDRPDPEIPADPLQFGGLYVCNGEPGHTLSAQFSLDGRRVFAVTIMTPADHRALREQGERIQAQDAVAEAERRAEEARVAATVDQLLAAVLVGNHVRFQALLGRGRQGRGPTFSDDRGSEPLPVPFTIEALRPIAAACRRDPRGELYHSFDQFDEILQMAQFICDGRPGYTLSANFEQNGTKISELRLEGPVRLAPN